ncbi:DUF4834 family protein [Pinibacter aurantiacus]|uniref:DUF4834 family protein n=1 Tax=Pinibacter aurantiacus TaxID=2851599 RepID=A0A9E2SAH8_9BACT|nr:DUF4834 family protein [Pinibacter aurantiacus]MBV4357727.1 DUF4834 family protein [Pinibacter aurantiacus]
MIIEFIFWAIGLYILYKLVFDFIIPVARTTQTVRKQFRTMQEQMNGQGGGFNEYYNQTNGNQASENHSGFSVNERHSKPSGDKEDYIDFEEVK